ncbi:HEAT repeat domain-containing protein [Anaeromyxobacter diazotrophicus]|uniref:HEAT repeat domain-containing protein n=1 Tax=Anaeromyxobacter diazotrophicus TaxID=2590199 RepID=A0A7I9VNS8_9BACT|nr:HEAT repeat domain-containing protein [Anaeromyxobacter diazotrophicus]GEJ58063.1 hypothetical protein AMYX_28040 [Anaeromyxobacter diazotrophicus]
MGFLDIFGRKSGPGALRKQAQKVTEKYGPPENRQKVIQQLAELGTPEALGVLCQRFTIRADPGITDDEEKENVRLILVEAGEKAVAPVKAFLETQESGVSWGLRVLTSLTSPAEVAETALQLLRRLGGEYTRDPEKKLVLLSWLAEQHGDLTEHAGPAASLEEAVLPLLEDFADDVRISAARLLARQPLTERTREALLALLERDRDNARVRGEVLQALAELGADVKGHRPAVEALLVEPWYLDREGHVKRRG